jgi:large subunit ribosomal protein L15
MKNLMLNELSPAEGANKPARRVGRGIGSGLGKTCGRGHKGQKSRAGGFHKVGFEGGQMPLARRIPKRGFVSLVTPAVTIRLDALNRIEAPEIDILVLKSYRLLKQNEERAKVVLKGDITKAIHLKHLEVTANAKLAIEKAGGSVTFAPPVEKVRKLPKKDQS